MDQSGVLLVVLDREGRVVLFSKACEIASGYGFGEVRGKPLWDILSVPEDRDAFRQAFEELWAAGRGGPGESAWVTRDGGRRTIGWTSFAPLEDDGGVRFAVGTGFDVTAHQQAEKSHAHLAAVVEFTEDAVLTGTLDGFVTSWNRSAVRMFGYEPSEVIGKHISLFFPPDRLDEETGILGRVCRGERIDHYQTKRRRKNGTLIDVRLTVSPHRDEKGTIVGVSEIIRDITEQVRTGVQSEVRNRVTRILTEESSIAPSLSKILQALGESLGWTAGELWETDRETAVLRCIHLWHPVAREGRDIVGPTPPMSLPFGVGLAGRAWAARQPIWSSDISTNEDSGCAAAAHRAGLKGACAIPLVTGDAVLGVLVFLRKDAQPIDEDVLLTMESLGIYVGLLLERQQTARELAQSEARLRMIIETAVDGIVTIDEEGRIESVNPATERLFGYAAAEMVGRNVSMFMPSPHREEHHRYLERYLRTGKKAIIGIGREVSGVRRDGTTFPLHLSVSEGRLGERRIFTGILRDLTDLKRMQEDLVRSRSLAAVGEVAASIAHEVKNPLAAIGGVIHVLRDGLPKEDARYELMGELLGQVSRLDRIVKQLLTLSRPWSPKKEPCDLRALLDRLVHLARDHGGWTGVAFEIEGGVQTRVNLDASLFEQVFWNLVQNAAQAMTKGGSLRLRIEESSSSVSLHFSDNGPGIPPDVMKNLFRPFVTTKKDGTGLGLPVCRKILEAHGGSIEMASEVGRGTVVTLRFPKT